MIKLRQLQRFAGRPMAVRAAQGLVLSLGAPAGWALLQMLAGVDVRAAVVSAPGVYLYMLVGTALAFTGFGSYVGLQEEFARRVGLRDPETGFYTDRYFNERLAEAYEHLRLFHDSDLSVLVLELKDLEQMGDRHGPRVEAELMSAIGSAARAVHQPGEHVARLRRGRLAVLIEGSGKEHARPKSCAERYGYAIQSAAVPAGTGRTAQTRVAVGMITAREYVEDGHNLILHEAIRAAAHARAQTSSQLVVEHVVAGAAVAGV